MTGLSSRCADPEVLAAFVVGSLSGDELTVTADHLRECEDCREVAAEAARVARDGVPVVPAIARPPQQRPWPWWLGVAAAALAGLVFLTFWSMIPDRAGRALQPLVEATPRDGRYLEPRLSGGFPWAPLRAARRAGDEPLDAGHMKLVGAAGTVLHDAEGQDSVEAKHATAVAHLLTGRPKEAADILAAAAATASDARIWSDLAASRYAAAMNNDDPPQYADALAAADAALRIDPKLPEALFNRALIIEQMGLREQARAAWEQYLAVDGGSEWATEARQHLNELVPRAGFRDELQKEYDALGRDALKAQALARRYPQEARVWGETEILARWADATQRGDVEAAARHLRVAGAFATELASTGDRMLLGAVQAIQGADADRRAALAAAHLTFRAAQRTYKTNQPAAAEPMFAEAAAGFARGGSPVTVLAQYFGANSIFDQGRVAEARARLEHLITTSRPELPAHRAQVQWQYGLTEASLGRWGGALAVLTDSVATFERLGETNYASSVRDILAEVYDRIGDRRAAWDHRIVALRELGRGDSSRVEVALDAAARAAAVNRDWPVTVSLLGLQVEVAKRGGDDLLQVEALLQRARVHGRIGDPRAAASDLMRANQLVDRLQDPTVRERAEADRIDVEAFLAPTPADALPLLTRAIDYHRLKGRHMHLPELLLQRGRAYAAVGKTAAAAEDFEAGIGEVERQRTSIGAGEQGWNTFAIADELFEEAVTLSMARGDASGAFAYTERARVGLDALPAVLDDQSPVAVSQAVVVQLASLPTRLIIFVVDRGRIRALQRAVDRRALLREVEILAQGAMANDGAGFRGAAKTLYQHIVAPIAKELAGTPTIVFVPDATLSGVPFAALLDESGHYVIERHAVVVAPSSAMFARLSLRQRPSRGFENLLLIAGAASRDGDVARLRSAQREAAAVAAAYGRPPAGGAKPMNSAVFEAQAATADVIHFVGHAVIPDGSSEAALMTSRNPGTGGRLEAREIAAMKFPRTRAVVLAACGTARGRQRPGETSISLARAFLAAGVPSVVATLWPIEDGPAAEFFPAFHQHLARGSSPAEALRAAQLEWVHRPNTPPGMWAAVQVIGS